MCFSHISTNRKSSVFCLLQNLSDWSLHPRALWSSMFIPDSSVGVSLRLPWKGPLFIFSWAEVGILIAWREQQSLIIALPARSWYVGPLPGAVVRLHVVYSVVEFGMPKERWVSISSSLYILLGLWENRLKFFLKFPCQCFLIYYVYSSYYVYSVYVLYIRCVGEFSEKIWQTFLDWVSFLLNCDWKIWSSFSEFKLWLCLEFRMFLVRFLVLFVSR